jgi:hypothetical protein
VVARRKLRRCSDRLSVSTSGGPGLDALVLGIDHDFPRAEVLSRTAAIGARARPVKRTMLTD